MANRSQFARWWLRHVGYHLEAVGIYALYGLFAALPLDAASALGGRLARGLGPRLAASRKAVRNLERALPEQSGAERGAVIAGMWENLGRTLAEYPHLGEIWNGETRGRIELVGWEHVEAQRASGRPLLFFSGHLANWEVLAVGSARRGVPLTLVYRRPNNPWVNRLLERARAVRGAQQVPKGLEAAREVVSTLKRGGAAAMLVDQKMREGIPVPFFGRDAMTAPAIAHFALRFNCPLIPARTERLGGARFRVTVYPPLELPRTGDRDADAREIMVRINGLLESWIRDRPEQWLWLHRRWPRE